MPKKKTKLAISLNLLKPQSNPEKITFKIFKWLLSSGRYIFVFVEALVLIAFGARFKLDADIAAKKEAIEEQIPYIESLKDYEILIRQTQLKLSTINGILQNTQNYSLILQEIANMIPNSTTLTTINVTKNLSNSTIQLTGQTPYNNDLIVFIAALKENNTFSNVNLTNIGLEKGIIQFTIDLNAKTVDMNNASI